MPLIDSGLELLDESTCLRLLTTVDVGRVAVPVGASIAVLPVNFVAVAQEVFFFTGEGVKLDAARAGAAVTFEADDLDTARRTGWSVMAVGNAEVCDIGMRRRLEALGLFPWAAGDRPHLVRIRCTFFSGRRVL